MIARSTTAKRCWQKAEKLGKKLLLPVDTAVAAAFPESDRCCDRGRELYAADDIPADKEGTGYRTEDCRAVRRCCKDLQRPLFGTDRWVYSRTRPWQQVRSQLQKHWLRPMQPPSSAAAILQQQSIPAWIWRQDDSYLHRRRSFP